MPSRTPMVPMKVGSDFKEVWKHWVQWTHFSCYRSIIVFTVAGWISFIILHSTLTKKLLRNRSRSDANNYKDSEICLSKHYFATQGAWLKEITVKMAPLWRQISLFPLVWLLCAKTSLSIAHHTMHFSQYVIWTNRIQSLCYFTFITCETSSINNWFVLTTTQQGCLSSSPKRSFAIPFGVKYFGKHQFVEPEDFDIFYSHQHVL